MIGIKIKKNVKIESIVETLERMGIANKNTKVLYPTCYLVDLNGIYYIAHFKELLSLEKDSHCFDEGVRSFMAQPEDLQRRDSIVSLLVSWGLIEAAKLENATDEITESVSTNFKVLTVQEKSEWKIEHKYNRGIMPTKRTS